MSKEKIAIVKKAETLREKAEKAKTPAAAKTRRLKKPTMAVPRPLKAVHRAGKKRINLPEPKSKIGKALNRDIRFLPKSLINAWEELRQVEWPNTRTTMKLTYAVFVFAIAFGLLVAAVDFGLDKAFKAIFLK